MNSATSIVEVFPPGRRREMVLVIAEHPEYDAATWKGFVHFRLYTRHDGTCGLGHWIETKEEEVGS